MKLKLLNVVLLAEDYPKLVNWYIKALGLEIQEEWTENYHYAELSYDKQLVVGITPAKEVDMNPPKPRNNAAIMQLAVSDIQAFLNRIAEHGGTLIFGPSFEESEGFYYGAVNDIEGNQIWVIQGA